MNSINILGRMTRDIEIRYSQGAEPVAVGSFSLAVDRRFAKEGQQDVDFINCVAFGKVAELIEQYVHKGNQLAVSGRLNIDRYEDKEGNKRSAPKVVVENMTFVSAPKDNQQSNQQGDGMTDGYNEPRESQRILPVEEDEDLPF